jgi:hypothetical protein
MSGHCRLSEPDIQLARKVSNVIDAVPAASTSLWACHAPVACSIDSCLKYRKFASPGFAFDSENAAMLCSPVDSRYALSRECPHSPRKVPIRNPGQFYKLKAIHQFSP